MSDEVIKKVYEENKKTNIPISKIIQNDLYETEVIVQIITGDALPQILKEMVKNN